MELSSAYWCAMVLHPQYRTRYLDLYFGRAKRDEVVTALRRLFRDEYRDSPAIEAAPADQWPSDARTEFLFGDDYLPLVPENGAIDEVNLYLSEPPFQVRDPIQWWKDNEGRFPRLSKMALTLLSILGMSAECERVFSQAKLLLTSQRHRDVVVLFSGGHFVCGEASGRLVTKEAGIAPLNTIYHGSHSQAVVQAAAEDG